MKPTLKLIALTSLLALAACSNDSDDEKTKSETPAIVEADGQATATPDAEAPAETPAEVPAKAPAAKTASESKDTAYLKDNKSKDGVQTTESGLQYKVLSEGDGATPTADDFVTVHYAGRLIDGSEFDSSYKRGEPATFPAGRLIKGFTEALLMMKVGDKWEITIPSELAYGERGGGDVIPPNATLIFDVELLAIKSEAEARAEQEAQMAELKAEFIAAEQSFLTENSAREGVKATQSGLQYKVLTEGTGKMPTAESKVTVHYEGKLLNGEVFDSSYKRGETIQFGLNQVIPGWTEGLQLMKEGAKYELYIPYALAYGERGRPSIPPFSTLIFTVELISVDS